MFQSQVKETENLGKLLNLTEPHFPVKHNLDFTCFRM
jgi:hypothetical protein